MAPPHIFFSLYHPQTNRIVKKLNRILCSSLAKVKEKDEDWEIYILAILFAYRTKRHTTNRYTSFQLVYSWQAILLIEIAILVKLKETDKHIKTNSSRRSSTPISEQKKNLVFTLEV